MKIHPKQSYHPFIVVAFYLHILPETLLSQIPRSTRYEWQHKPVIEIFGYAWYCQNQHLFKTLQDVAASKRLLKINTALLRIIAIQRFLQRHQSHIRHKLFNAAGTVVHNINKTQEILGLGGSNTEIASTYPSAILATETKTKMLQILIQSLHSQTSNTTAVQRS